MSDARGLSSSSSCSLLDKPSLLIDASKRVKVQKTVKARQVLLVQAAEELAVKHHQIWFQERAGGLRLMLRYGGDPPMPSATPSFFDHHARGMGVDCLRLGS
jgi:hypothetical protein